MCEMSHDRMSHRSETPAFHVSPGCERLLNLAALTRMRLTTIHCQLTDTFAGFLSTVRYLPAVALVSYLFDRSDSLYAAFLKIFVLVQGTHTPLVIRHDRRTDKRQPSCR